MKGGHESDVAKLSWPERGNQACAKSIGRDIKRMFKKASARTKDRDDAGLLDVVTHSIAAECVT